MAHGGPTIKAIRGWGTSWYKRGPTYWLRRLLYSAVMLALFGLFAFITGFFVSGTFGGSARRSPDLGPGLTVLGIVTVVSIVGFVWMWRWTPDPRESAKEAKQLDVFITAWLGLRWIVLILVIVGAVAGGVVRRSLSAAVLLLIGLAFFGLSTFLVGPLLALFVKSLIEEPRMIRVAREEVDDWYREQGLDSRGSIRPT